MQVKYNCYANTGTYNTGLHQSIRQARPTRCLESFESSVQITYYTVDS